MAHKKEGKERILDPRVDRIWEYMREKKMNLKKLVDVTKLSYPHVCNMMNGRKALSYDVLEKIALGLKLPMEYFLESEIVNERKPRITKKSPLMSEILTHVKEILAYVEKNINVDGLRQFFNTEPTRPLIATGHGGKYSQAAYAALLYSTNQGLGRAVTCYSCNSLSDATIRNSKILLVSRGMANIDIEYIAQRCIRLNPDYTCAMRVNNEDNEKKYKNTVEKVKKLRYSFFYDLDIDLPEHFIGISSVFFYSALLYKAFTNDNDFVSRLELSPNPTENYTYLSANSIATIPTLDKITHFTVLYGSYAEPVAYNIESNIVEGGIASCMISDYKNYTHGRFMVEANYIKSKYHPQTEAALICLVTPREANIYEDLIQEMPPHLPVITIRTDLLTPLATIDLLYKANMFASYLGEHFHKTNPNDPTLFNTTIDKRMPKNNVHFEPDFKVWGALDVEAENKLLKKTKRDLKVDIKSLNDLFDLRDKILEDEIKRSDDCRINWKNSKPITWDDFAFRQTHEYDTQKQECWSFNSKTDVRDGISLQLGNMANGYGVEILGLQFPNSEIPYQLAIFKDDAVKVQEEIINPNKGWLYNGLKMKRKFIYSKENGKDIYWKYRRDTEFEDGKELWCFEWMKWIVWEKVKQNKGFADILLAIPKNAIIIEQAQKRTHLMWGAWNEDLLKDRKIVIRAAQIENGLGKTSQPVRDVIYRVNNVGKWVGENAMGQILTMAKLALNEGCHMPIDEQLLNNAMINWFGKVLHFTKNADGSVSVEAVTRSKRAFKKATDATKPFIEESSNQILSEASEGYIYLQPDMEVNGYKLYCCYTPLEAQAVKKTRWCYCNAEGKYRFYTQNTGFLFVAAKKGYADIKNPHQGNDVNLRFKLYDDFATSLFSLTTFINPKTNKADIYSVTFRRNDTSHQYEGIHMNTYNEMMQKASELLGGFDIAKYCIQKTEEKLSIDNSTGSDATDKHPMPRMGRAKETVID